MVRCFPFADSCLFLVFSRGKALRGLKGTKGRGQEVSREASYSVGGSVQEVGKGRAGYELGRGAVSVGEVCAGFARGFAREFSDENW